MKALSLILSLWCFCLATRNVSSQENWTRFRGPNADGVAQDNPQLPTQWNQNENILWKTDIPGLGWSSPVIWENKVFLTTVTSDGTFEKPKSGLYNGEGRKEIPGGKHQWLVYCLDRDRGRFSGKRSPSGHPSSKGATPKTPMPRKRPVSMSIEFMSCSEIWGCIALIMAAELFGMSPLSLKKPCETMVLPPRPY